MQRRLAFTTAANDRSPDLLGSVGEPVVGTLETELDLERAAAVYRFDQERAVRATKEKFTAGNPFSSTSRPSSGGYELHGGARFDHSRAETRTGSEVIPCTKLDAVRSTGPTTSIQRSRFKISCQRIAS